MTCTQTLFQTTSKITAALARSGQITCARKLFDEMSQRDSTAWNAMLTSYTQLGFHQEAISLFHHMRISHTGPDHFTLTATLSACAGAFYLRCGTDVHALITVLGYQSYLPVNNSLIDMVEIAWNIMIVGYARYGEVESCLDLLNKLRESLCQPDQWTFSAPMIACAEALEFWHGCMVHALIIKSGWSSAAE
ncbi:PREDICTED: pentatricopeptide, partial [Prunus dulcis]